MRPYDALVLLIALQRVIELALSRRNERIAVTRHGATPVANGHFPAMAIMHVLFLVACVIEAHALRLSFAGWLGGAALLVLLVAEILRVWALATLGPRWSVRIVVWPRASPVTGGPYRYLRHPNYLAVVLEIAALPLVVGALRTMVVFTLANAAMLGIRIRAEERALGPAYAEAFRRTPRLIPQPGRGQVSDGARP